MSYLLDCLPVTFFWAGLPAPWLQWVQPGLPVGAAPSQPTPFPAQWWACGRYMAQPPLCSLHLEGFGITGWGCLCGLAASWWGGLSLELLFLALRLHIFGKWQSPSGGREQSEVGTQKRERLGGQGFDCEHVRLSVSSTEMPLRRHGCHWEQFLEQMLMNWWVSLLGVGGLNQITDHVLAALVPMVL